MPPSVIVAEGDGRWMPRDRVAAVALTIFEVTRCSGCGQGLADTWDVTADVQVVRHVCAGCKALDEKRREREPEPGEKLGIGRLEPHDDTDEVAPVFI